MPRGVASLHDWKVGAKTCNSIPLYLLSDHPDTYETLMIRMFTEVNTVNVNLISKLMM